MSIDPKETLASPGDALGAAFTRSLDDAAQVGIAEIAPEIAAEQVLTELPRGDFFSRLPLTRTHPVNPPLYLASTCDSSRYDYEPRKNSEIVFCGLRDAALLGAYSYVVDRDLRVVAEGSLEGLHNLWNARMALRMQKNRRASPQVIDYPIVKKTSLHPQNFGHLIMDNLCLSAQLDALPWNADKALRHSFAGATGQAMRFFYNAFFPHERVFGYQGLFCRASQIYFSKRLQKSAEDIDWLREQTSPWQTTASPSRRLFLSRRPPLRRRILNEEKLLPLFKSLGIETVFPETLPVGQQIQLAAEAEMIIGPSGAALCNAAFMRPGGLLVELSNHQWRDNAWVYEFANTARVLFAKVVGSDEANPEQPDYPDFTIDPQELGDVLSMLL